MTGRDGLPPPTRRALDELRRLEPPRDLLRSVVLEAETTPQRRPIARGLQLVAFATATAMLLVAVAITLPQLSDVGPPRSAGISPAGSTQPLGGAVDLRIPVPDGAHTGSADATGIWLGQPSTGLVIRLDPRTGAELGRVHVDEPTTDLYDLWPVSDGESVWVGGFSDRSLVRIDIASMEVAARFRIDAVPYRIQPAGDIVWVTDFDDHEVLAVDASDGTIRASIPVASASGIAVAADSVYVAGYTGTLVEIDPEDPRVVASHAIGSNATDLVVLDGRLLAWGLRDRPLDLIDPLTGQILATASDVTGVALQGGQPWAAIRQGMVVRLDPATLAYTASIPLGDVSTDQLVAAPDRLWAYAATDEATFIYAVSAGP